MARYLLTIDQGTTGSRVFLYDDRGRAVASSYKEFTQYYPKPGWVEHDPEEIYQDVLSLISSTIEKARISPQDVHAIGITNQRETTVLWEKDSGRPCYKAIVWQCRRTAPRCEELKKEGLEKMFREKTGLVVDAYFSATKIEWILKNVDSVEKKAKEGKILFGTIDTYLLWKLTGGEAHKSDYTNASRTLIFNIHEKRWDEDLLKVFEIPSSILPEVQESASLFGKTKGIGVLPDGIPIYAMVGDQQSALYAQLCFQEGEAKNTYGTGCFLLMNTGDKAIQSKKGLLTTLACDSYGKPVYALEGAVFIAGAVIQFLRDNFQFFQEARETEAMARRVEKEDEVVFIPAFTGLGAPYWNSHVRGAIFGLTRDTTKEQIVRAALKSIAFQSYEVLKTMEEESGIKLKSLKVDGGASKNNYLMQFQSALLGVEVIRPQNVETTAQGAAYLAGIGSGFFSSPDELKEINPPERIFHPEEIKIDREREISLWKKAIDALIKSV